MTREYRPRHSIPLEPGTTFRRPARPPDWVQLDDPAMSVFTDFLEVEPRTVSPEEPIDDALERMKTAGVRLLLVAEDEAIIGVISAKDIHGERPIQLTQERRVPRTELVVRDIMTPQAEISVLNMLSVEEATVGHILATLHQLERQHTLVVETDEASGSQVVRGMFSASQILRQMHRHEGEQIPAAHSLADIVKTVG